jgi:hypothetical protein
MKGADARDLSIPNEDKKISEMVVEFTKGPGKNSSSWGIEFDQPLDLFDIIDFGFPYHPFISQVFD